jgi:two-component system NtrC family response regulator/two-component system nitrogen regulation response regulator GlnG
MAESTTHRILVVDDEQDMAQGLRRLLRLEGYEVEVANSGEEAIRRARDWHPEGILMDLKMPGIDGLDAYRGIRLLCPNAFVIFMTGYSVMAEQAGAEGAVAVLSKPLDPASTCEMIANALSK